MKRILLLISLLCATQLLFSQTDMDPKNGYVVATQFGVTRPLSEIFKENPVDENKPYREKVSGDRKLRPAQQFPNKAEDDPKYGNDESIIQKGMGHIEGSNGLKANWAGQTASGFRPYDPSGAAGPNHYVQMINSTTFKVYNKTTGVVTLTATLGNLWSPATANAGDPIVMYDKTADRWFLAQFGSGNNNIYIAVSTSPDPTGSYYTYTFVSPQFPDYLKFSVWSDGYYMTSNQAQKVFCFERDAMLAGVPGARSVYTSYAPPQGSGFFVPLPGDAADGTLPPVGTPCPIFSYSDNGWGAGYQDAVNIYQMSVNWVPAIPTGTITLAANVLTNAFDASYNASWNDCVQPGTTQKLDGIGGICMYRAQWKSWAGYNTVVLNWAVTISATQRSIFWCELRQDQTTGVWSMYQQGIYAPDTNTRWMGSMSMDNNGGIGIAYIKSNSTSIYPGLYYSGRRPCDPLGTLPVTEVEVIAGTGFQTGTNRVGDYAHTCLDPDGVTFWCTSEYMGGTSGASAARTRIFSWSLPTCSTDASVSISVTGGNNPVCPGLATTFTALGSNTGTTPVYQWKVNGNNVGTNSATYSSSSLTAGDVVTCVMTSNLPGVTNNPATSNAITITVATPVAPAVAIAITGGSNPTCPGVGVTFTATPTNGGATPSYQWKVNGGNVGTNSATYSSTTLTNSQVVTCVMTSSLSCTTVATATSNAITMTVNSSSTPTVSIAQTGGTNPLCAGTLATFTATVGGASSPTYQWQVNGSNVGTNSPTYSSSSLTNGQIVSCSITAAGSCPAIGVVGTGTTLNGTTSPLGAAYPTYYGNGRQQWLIRASELTALGLSAGNITSIGFNVGNTTGDPITLNGYTIKMAQTAATVLTATFQTGAFTTVFGPSNYTPTLNTLNTHSFTNNFAWDGTSNVIVDICFSNQVVGNAAYVTTRSQPAFNCATYYQADAAGGAGACTIVTGTVTTWRPNMTVSIGGGNTSVNSNTISMTVNANVTPAVSIALTSGTNPTCSGSSLSFTATPSNGGTTPSYQWQVNGSNVGTNSATYSSSSLTNGQVVTCIMTSNSACASPSTATSNGITVTVNTTVAPSVSIALTSGTNPTCSGSSLTFTATPTNGGTTPAYQWQVNGSNVGTNSATYTSSSLTNGQVVTCIMTSNTACASPSAATSNGITVTVSATVAPSVSVALTTGTIPSCTGATLTFTATPTNGGTTPSYQWQVNGSNVGTNSPTYTTSGLTNGQFVTCIMTSNSACASPLNATSNSITYSTNSNTSITGQPIASSTCDGGNASFTVSAAGTSLAYQWEFTTNGISWNPVPASLPYTNTQSPTLNISGATTFMNTFTYRCVVSGACGSVTSNPAQLTVAGVVPSVSIALTLGSNPTCQGEALVFTATPVNGGTTPSYVWFIDGNPIGNNSPTFSTFTLTNGQAVSCELTSNAPCANPVKANSNSIAITVITNVTPEVSISLTSGSNPTCAGSSLTFTAAPTFGGIAPVYQWQVNGSNVGTNSATYTTSSLTNGQVVTCIMTSNEICTTSNVANSNAINIVVSTSSTWYADTDNDGYGNPNITASGCTAPLGYVGNSSDCNDSNGSINPGASEICGNGVDEDCDTFINEGCCAMTASATATNSSCAAAANGTVNLTVSGGTLPLIYAWSNAASTEDLSAVAPGTYSVTVTDVNGCTASTSAIVGNNNLSGPSAPGAITGPYGVCVNQTGVQFSVAPVAGATSYVWILPNGMTGTSTTNTILVNIGSTFGTSNICVRAVNACGQSAQTCKAVTKFASNPSTPGVISGVNLNVCAGTTQTYSIAPVTSAESYVWTAPTNASIISGQGTTTVTVQFAANFGASGVLVVRSVNCFGNSGNRTLTIYNIPAMPGNITGPSNNICGGSTQTFSIAAVAGASSYNWTVPAGAVINTGQGTTSISVTFPVGYYSGQIGVSAVSSCGSSSPRLKNVYLNPVISSPMTGTQYDLCAGGNFTYAIPVVAGATAYNWTLPAGCTMVVNNGNSVTINVPAGFTSGNVCVTAVNGCGGSISTCRAIYGRPNTPASITGSTSVCPNQTGISYSTPNAGAFTYTWTVPATCSITAGQGTTNATVNWGSANGNVSVKAGNSCGNSPNRTIAVAVVACLEGANENSEVPTGLLKKVVTLSVYPNPNDGRFFVKAEETGTFVLVNNIGQVINAFSLNNENGYTVEFTDLPTGLYFIQGRTEDGFVNQKIIVANK